MAAAAYPCVTGTVHRTLGPPAGHLRNKPTSLEIPFRSGPRNCGQSDPCAAGSREATPAAPAPMIQRRRVYIQHVSSCVEKNHTFDCSITRYSGLKICRIGAFFVGDPPAVGFRPVMQACDANWGVKWTLCGIVRYLFSVCCGNSAKFCDAKSRGIFDAWVVVGMPGAVVADV